MEEQTDGPKPWPELKKLRLKDLDKREEYVDIEEVAEKLGVTPAALRFLMLERRQGRKNQKTGERMPPGPTARALPEPAGALLPVTLWRRGDVEAAEAAFREAHTAKKKRGQPSAE